MNYNELVKQYERSVTVASYKLHSEWVLTHLKRLCEDYSWMEIGKPIKHSIYGSIRISNLQGVIIHRDMMDGFIGLDTGFGNIWYFEVMKPTKKELKKFDGHCLYLGEDENFNEDGIN